MGGLLAVNIGNSRVGLGLFEFDRPAPPSPRPEWSGSFALPTDGSFSPTIDPEIAPSACVIASVNPRAEAPILRWIQTRYEAATHRFPSEVPSPYPTAYQAPGRAGADRIANAVAAFEEHRQSSVIVDAGTAITVDAVADDGTFLGGTIIPGPSLWTSALASGTALLPAPDLCREGPAIGKNTEDAIRSGVLRGIAGAVDRLVADISSELGGDRRTFLTGGGAPTLQRLCHTEWTLRPHLALAGLVIAYRAFCAR